MAVHSVCHLQSRLTITAKSRQATKSNRNWQWAALTGSHLQRGMLPVTQPSGFLGADILDARKKKIDGVITNGSRLGWLRDAGKRYCWEDGGCLLSGWDIRWVSGAGDKFIPAAPADKPAVQSAVTGLQGHLFFFFFWQAVWLQLTGARSPQNWREKKKEFLSCQEILYSFELVRAEHKMFLLSFQRNRSRHFTSPTGWRSYYFPSISTVRHTYKVHQLQQDPCSWGWHHGGGTCGFNPQ